MNQSITAARPSCQVTAAIRASDAALTPSRKPEAQGEFRNLGMNGLLINTKTKAGKKIPMVASIAPDEPATTYPIKVAVVKTGPGKLAYRNCIEKLLVGKPVPTVHEISSEKRQKHVTTAKQHRSNFEKKRVSFRRLTGTMGMIAFDAPAFTGIKNIQRIGSRLAYGFLFSG